MIQPTELDVLCGKRASVYSPGNMRFRDIIDAFADQYAAARNKAEKMITTKTIYQKVAEKSRFLKFSGTTNCWEELTPLAARDKISHALRFAYGAPSRSKLAHIQRPEPLRLTKTPRRDGSGLGGPDVNYSATKNITTSSVAVSPSMIPEPSSLPKLLVDQPLLSSLPEASPPIPTYVVCVQMDNSNFQIDEDDKTVLDTLKLLQKTQCLLDSITSGSPDQLSYDKLPAVDYPSIDLAASAPKRDVNGNLLTLMKDPIGEWEEQVDTAEINTEENAQSTVQTLTN